MQKILMFLFFLCCCAPLNAIFNCESYDAALNLEHVSASLMLDENLDAFGGTLRLRDNSAGSLTNTSAQVINFVDGTVTTGDSSSASGVNATSFSGQYNLAGTDKLILSNGAVLDCSTSGTIYQAIEVGDGTTTLTARIVGQPYFAQDILVKNNATLEIGIESYLNRNIVLESTGKLKLITNLRLADGVQIKDSAGNATADVFLNNLTLEIGSGTTFTSTGGLVFQQTAGESGKIVLRGNITVTGTWYFTAGAVIDGRGCWINWGNFAGSTSGPIFGKLWGGAVTNIVINNLGIIFPASGMWENELGETLNFFMRSNCRLKLGGSYVLTSLAAINVYSRKEGNVIITGANTLAFSINCTLRVEYVPLFYDTLDQPNATNISGNITYSETPNPTLIPLASVMTDTRTYEKFAQLDFTLSSTGLTQDHWLSLSSKINFLNGTPAVPKPMTFNGAGYTINFPEIAGGYFNIAENIQLTLQNVILNNFNPQAISYQDLGGVLGTILFGDGVIIKMRKDLKVAFTDPSWTFVGNAEIHGADLTLTLSGENKLTVLGSTKNVLLNKVTLRPQGAYTFDNLSADSKIIFKNSTIVSGLDGCAIRTGNIDIDGTTKIIGIEQSYFNDGLFLAGTYGSVGAWTTAFRDLNKLKAVRRLGFTETDARCSNVLGRIDLCDVSTYSANQVLFTIDEAGQIWIRINGSFTRYDTTADFASGNIGVDGKAWVIKNDRSVFRIDGVNTFVSGGINADLITVGNQNYVYILQNDTGNVYQCSNPMSGIPTTWVQITNIKSPKSIAAGLDGTLWYIDSIGRVFKRYGTEETLVHDGTGKDFTTVCVSGDGLRNFLALQTSSTYGGRVLISKDNGPLRDLGLPKIANMAIGVSGSIVFSFLSSVFVDEPGAPTRQPIWERFTGGQDLSLFLDRTFTFSSDANLTIKSGATLQVCDGATLFYNGNSAGNESVANAKKHLVAEDSTAVLHLLDGNLNTGNRGIALESGNLVVEGLCSLITSTAANKQAILSSAVKTKIRDGSKLQVFGKLDYSQPDRV